LERKKLILVTGAMFAAMQGADLTVVGTYFGHGAVAPAMADAAEFLGGRFEHVILFGGNIHFFRPEIFAEIRVHGVDRI
jgi:hypothetical protein